MSGTAVIRERSGRRHSGDRFAVGARPLAAGSSLTTLPVLESTKHSRALHRCKAIGTR